MKHTHFFLGANSAEGFCGLYEQLLDAKLYDLIILKGGPGCGKSTFMRRAAAAMEERGLDGTAPHGMDTLGHRCAYLPCSACSSCMSATQSCSCRTLWMPVFP